MKSMAQRRKHIWFCMYSKQHKQANDKITQPSVITPYDTPIEPTPIRHQHSNHAHMSHHTLHSESA